MRNTNRSFMRIEIRLYGGFAVAAGSEHANLEFEGTSLGEAIAQMRRRWPAIGELLDGPGKGSAVFVLNGRALEPPDPRTKLNTGDVLSIMPFVAGG